MGPTSLQPPGSGKKGLVICGQAVLLRAPGLREPRLVERCHWWSGKLGSHRLPPSLKPSPRPRPGLSPLVSVSSRE